MKYRKLPVEIEAQHFATNNDDSSCGNEIVSWIVRNGGEAAYDRTEIAIKTLEGTMYATVGDYIVRGVAGEFYPCKPDIFAKTYEAV